MINRLQGNSQYQQSFGMKFKGLDKKADKILKEIVPNVDPNPIKTIFEKSNLVKEIDAKYPKASARQLEAFPGQVYPFLGITNSENTGFVGIEIKLRKGAKTTLAAFSDKIKQSDDFHNLYKDFEELINNTRLKDIETEINQKNKIINSNRNSIVRAVRRLFGYDKTL